MDDAWKKNIFFTLVTLVYVKIVVTACDYWLSRGVLAKDVSRKIIHVAACSWCLFWPYFDTQNWTWKGNVAVPFAYAIQLFFKGAILCDPNDQDVKTMSRSGRPSELLYGPLQFTLIMLFCGLHEFMQPCGTYIMGAMLGDGIAPLIGKRYPWGRYPTLGGETKTISGSIGVFLGSLIGIIWYQKGLGVPDKLDIETSLQTALVATLAEAVSGKYDNPVIAISVYAFVTTTNVHL